MASRSAANLLLIGPILGLAGVAAATDPQPAGDDRSSLIPVTVTTRRIAEDRDKAPAAVGVVAGDDVQGGRQQLGLGESLVRIPGLFLQNQFNFAQDLRLSSRGFGARSSFGIRGLKVSTWMGSPPHSPTARPRWTASTRAPLGGSR